MTNSTKTLIAALVLLNVALVGLLLFRDRSVVPANAAHDPQPIAIRELAATTSAATTTTVEHPGGTAFAELARPAPAMIHNDSEIDPAYESQAAADSAPQPRRAMVEPTKEPAPRPRPDAQAAPRPQAEAQVATLPASNPVLPPAATTASETRVPPVVLPPRPTIITIPAGQRLTIKLGVALHSRQVRAGDVFEASLAEDLDLDGRQIAAAGSPVTGRVTEVIQAGKSKGVEHLSVTLQELSIANRAYALTASTLAFTADDTKEKEAAMIGGGAVVGAIIGGIAGGKKGAAAGAVTGAAAGTGVALSTRGKAIDLESGTRLEFNLTESLRITLPDAAREPATDGQDSVPDSAPGVARR